MAITDCRASSSLPISASRLWSLEISDAELEAMALPLGADVPVCIGSRARMMGGIGEVLDEAPALPPVWMVLVNGALHVGMSGSGATCYALFATREAAVAGAKALRSAERDWWVEAGPMRA